MPIFEYQCRDCGARFEKLLRSASETVTCTRCEGRKLDRLLSVFAVSGPAGAGAAMEEGPCGACGAPRRGMCGE